MEMNVEEKKIDIGGNLASALKGEYKLNVQAILTEAWGLAKQHRTTLNISMLIVFFIGVSVTLLVASFLGGTDVILQNPQANLILQIIITVVISPLLASMDMMGVFHSVGLKTQPKLLSTFWYKASAIILCAFITAVVTNVGLALFILPGVYLIVALNTTMPLILEKELSPLKAILVSIQATRFQWIKLFVLYAVLTLALLLSAIPMALLMQTPIGFLGLIFFIFALSYLVPLFYHVKGIIYREIFGVQLTALPNNVVVDDTFSA